MATPRVFLFGTLCHEPLLAAVAGADLPSVSASLPGCRAVWVAGEAYPMMLEDAGAQAVGLVVEPNAGVLARLDFYEACFGYARRAVSVLLDGVSVEADAWFPAQAHGTPGDPWLLDDWVRDWGAITTRAAAEVMRQMGRAEPRRVGARFGIIKARAHAELRTARWQRPRLAGSTMGAGDVLSHQTDYVYDGFFNMEEVHVSHRRFDGRTAGPMSRAVYKVADAVTVLPYDPVRDTVLVVEQIRMGALSLGDPNPWLLEPIAGLIDAGEDPETTARREAVEESNLAIGALHFIGRYYPTPGGVAQVLESYLGIADLPEAKASTGGHADENEDILSHVLTYDLACRMLAEGDMAQASLILSMQYLMLHRDALRREAGVG